jgi:hypothetical protein
MQILAVKLLQTPNVRYFLASKLFRHAASLLNLLGVYPSRLSCSSINRQHGANEIQNFLNLVTR